MSDATKDSVDALGQDTETMRPPTGVRTSDTTTRGIRVEVVSDYVPERSSPAEQEYFFQYHVRL